MPGDDTYEMIIITSVAGLYLTGIDAGGGEGMGVHQSVQSAIKVARHLGA